MNHLEQARDLLGVINRTLHTFREGMINRCYDEGEVSLRHEAIYCMLIMARNDTEAMLRDWEEAEMEALADAASY